MTPDWPALYRSIQRCNAVYDPNHSAAMASFVALGADVLGRYSNDSHQAIAHRSNGRATLTISGTRVTEGTIAQHFGDLLSDAIFSPWDIGGGASVAAGALEGMGPLWDWALSLFANDMPIDVEGHSLGGQRTCLTPIHVPGERIGTLTAWEPPKAGNLAFWTQYADVFERLTIVCHAKDPWYHWAWASELIHKPGASILWLHDGAWSMVADSELPGLDVLAWADHGPDTVVAAVRALVG